MKTKLLIFGITGDLSTRKLLPALEQVVQQEDCRDIEIIGISRRKVDVSQLVENDQLRRLVSIFTMNLAEAPEYDRLKKYIALKKNEQLIIYLSVPPQAATQIVDFLGEAGINTPHVKILFEKPFGVDLVSAREMIDRTSRFFNEDQLYRIDHYLAKEMAQNIIVFRGGNALFSDLWDHDAIERIEIVSTEKIGIEGRTTFYEQTGALRDLVQGHMLQLLALILMETPVDFDWDMAPKLRLRALQQIAPADPTQTIRAQYAGYQDEVENPGSLVETFVSLQLRSNDPRWQYVPIRITTGKALDKKTTEMRIFLKKKHEAQQNMIVFRIQPNEGVGIQLFIKKPGLSREFETRELSLAFPEDTRLPDAYEQVLVDAILSKKSLFTSSDEVLESWRILAPLQEAWGMDDEPLRLYAAGSAPEEVVQGA